MKNIRTIDFEGLASPGGSTTYATNPGVTISGLTFTSFNSGQDCPLFVGCTPTSSYSLDIVNPASPPTAPLEGSHLRLPRVFLFYFGPVGSESSSTLTIDLGAGETALGWDFSQEASIPTFNSGPSVTLSNADVGSYSKSLPGGFLGFVASSNITTVTIPVPRYCIPFRGDGCSGELAIDNVSVGEPVPEPSTLLMAGLALGLAAARRGISAIRSR